MKSVSVSVSSVFKCDCGCGMEVSQSGQELPAGWKAVSAKSSSNPFESPKAEKHVCAACLASQDPEEMAEVLAIIASQ
jgi:hypothetical protein